MELMEHSYAELNNIADRYVLGKLGEIDRDEFEEHFIGCSDCVQTLREIRMVRRALEIAGSDAVQGAPSNPGIKLGVLFPSFTRLQAFTAIAMFLVLLSIPLLFLLSEIRRLREAHDQTVALNRSLSQELQDRDTENRERRQPPVAPDKAGDKSVAARPLSAGGQRTFRPEGPVPNTQVFSLSGGKRSGVTPDSNRIVINPSARFFTILLVLEGGRIYEKYRAYIRSENGALLRTTPPLSPHEDRTLTIGFSRAPFPRPGNYVIVLEGSDGNSTFELVDSYRFSFAWREEKTSQ
jgi:hypothetical protein